MEGTVNEASLEEGRPERCGTPDGDGVVLAGAMRGSCLVSADTVLPSGWFLCIVPMVAAALEATAGLTGTATAGLLGAGLGAGFGAACGAVTDFTTALVAAGGDFLGALLASGAATLGLPGAALAGLAADFVAVLVALEAVLAFAGMAFTS